MCASSPTTSRGRSKRLAEREAELIDAEPRPGAHGAVAFVHPRTLDGVLWELLQAETQRRGPGD